MGDFKKLVVWSKARALTLAAYRATASFPGTERFELSGQIRKAAISICANIAEGTGRITDHDQARFYQMALGSARELEALFLVSQDLGFIADREHTVLAGPLDEVQRMLVALIRRSREGRPPSRLASLG